MNMYWTKTTKTEMRGTNNYIYCICVCGTKKWISQSNLDSGKSKSCGCKQAELSRKKLVIHGKTGTKVYSIWNQMIQRCTNYNASKYKAYGGRGIRVCTDWLKFDNFYRDMGDPPPFHSIDRKNVNEDYCKSNCKWATDKEQAANRQNTVYVKYEGKFVTLMKASELSGIPLKTLKCRYYERRDLYAPVRKQTRR